MRPYEEPRPVRPPRAIRPRGAALLRLYPRRWRERYEAEMLDLLRVRPPRQRAGFDLVRGAADAWLHPTSPSAVPGVAAVVGAAAWLVVTVGVLAQPVPPDWPGYLAETLIPAALAAAVLLVAIVGAWLRTGDQVGRSGVIAIDVAVAGHAAWATALVAALVGLDYGPATAIAQAAAAVGTALVGVVLLRGGEGTVGALLVVAACGMVVPSPWGWLAAGMAWIAVGAVELRGRAWRPAVGPVG